jgi:hypothetical protein
MAKKKKTNKKDKELNMTSVVYGVFDCIKKELIKVSLDEDEIEMDLTLQFGESRYSKCEFVITLTF